MGREIEETPQPRRRRGETEGDFRKLARKLSRRFNVQKQFRKAARNRARRRVRTIILSSEAWGAHDAHLTDTAGLVNLWNSEAAAQDYGGNFDTNKNHISPGM